MNVTDKELKMFDCFLMPTALTYLKWRKKNINSLRQQKHSTESMAFEYMKTVHNANNNTLNSFIIDRSFNTSDDTPTTSSRRGRSSSRRRTSKKTPAPPPPPPSRRGRQNDSANEEDDLDENEEYAHDDEEEETPRRR